MKKRSGVILLVQASAFEADRLRFDPERRCQLVEITLRYLRAANEAYERMMREFFDSLPPITENVRLDEELPR